MCRMRGFLLKHRVATVLRRVFRRNPHRRIRVKPVCRFISWARLLRTKAKAIVAKNMDPFPGYTRVGQEPDLGKPVSTPKGHLAVYVGQKDGDFERLLVPVLYFNHPLFGDLLRESENEYGFDYSGGITIPCPVSEFERVQTWIEAGQCAPKMIRWKRSK